MRNRRRDAASDAAASAAAAAAIRRRWRPERSLGGKDDTSDTTNCHGCDGWQRHSPSEGSPRLRHLQLSSSSSGNSHRHCAPTALGEAYWAPQLGDASITLMRVERRDSCFAEQPTTYPSTCWFDSALRLDHPSFGDNHSIQYAGEAHNNQLQVDTDFLRRNQPAPPPPTAFMSPLPLQHLLVAGSGKASPASPYVAIPSTVPLCESPGYDIDDYDDAGLVPTTVLQLRVSDGDRCCGVGDDGDSWGWPESGFGFLASSRRGHSEENSAVALTEIARPIPISQSTFRNASRQHNPLKQSNSEEMFMWQLSYSAPK